MHSELNSSVSLFSLDILDLLPIQKLGFAIVRNGYLLAC